MTCTMSSEQSGRRLRLTGCCEAGDREQVEEAIAKMAREGKSLIVDLSAATSLDPTVAEAIASAWTRCGSPRVSVLRRCGSEIDHVLREWGL